MGEHERRPMRPDDWVPEAIERGRYFNRAHDITGYQRADGSGGTVLHPACVIEDRLFRTFHRLRDTWQDIHIVRRHVRMPFWDADDPQVPGNYAFVDRPEQLTTTSISVILVPQDLIKTADMGYYFRGSHLPTLRERMAGSGFSGLAGNLGYFMTEGLIKRKFLWSHNVRYPEFPLPTLLAYIGFHLFRDVRSGQAYGSFQGAHPAAVGIRGSGRIDIIPRLEIERYGVRLWGEEFFVDSVNSPEVVNDVMLFTPGLRTDDVQRHEESWQSYAPEIPIPDRVNVFVANEGNGSVPIEKVVSVWHGRAPLPSFGAVLSFDRIFFEQRFVKTGTFVHLDEPILIEPLDGLNFEDYDQVMGGFVPAVVDRQHLYPVNRIEQVIERLRDYGNATSPIPRCGRETNNFDPRVREPAGVLAQTENHIGWILFDGRHELSIGASVADVGHILHLLQNEGVFGSGIRQAIFIDGGSAMKVYAIDSVAGGVDLELLNRVAAGSRNGPGMDPDGLNLYTLLKLGL